MNIVEAENKLQILRADLAAEANRAEAKAQVAREITKIEEQQKLEAQRVEMNKSKYEAEVVVPAEANKEAKVLEAIGEAASIVEDGKATAEAVRVMREQWEKEDTRELFLIQQLPDILDKVTSVVAENVIGSNALSKRNVRQTANFQGWIGCRTRQTPIEPITVRIV